jgi:hypothetical protein
MRVSTTQIESFRLWNDPEQEWMTEDDLIATIRGEFKPTPKVTLGKAFGAVLEDPDAYAVEGGYRVALDGTTLEFGADVMAPCLAEIERNGCFEVKTVKTYGDVDVVSKCDHLYGARLSEFKTTLSSFDFDKYAASCQWRFMADAFQPHLVRYHVFCLNEATNGVISLRECHRFNLYPYAALHEDCARLVREFRAYVISRGLDGVLKQRQLEAA